MGHMPDGRNQPQHGDDDADGVSWRLIATGMPVLASEGTLLGHVTHALGDPDRDIFDGVGFRHHLWSSSRMAPAAVVARITESAVHLSITAAQAEQCPAYQEEHVFKIGNTGFFRHREGWRPS
ncbi:MAG TPA: hypothetical protein VGX75_07565 [bacterium]|jgi:hypothetical protein|nr:hypothetical protein [bacterium]